MNTNKSKEIFEKAKKSIPGGVNSPVRAFQSVKKDYPIFIESAKGSKLFDEDGNEYSDNAERAIFYARGVLETVKKLRWKPDVIHCHGWISSIAPFFIKTAYKEEPAFADAKVVFSACSDELQTPPAENFKECLQFRELPKATIDHLDLDLSSPNALSMLALNYSDGFIQAEEGVSPELMAYAQKLGLPTLNNAEVEDTGKAYADFFERLYE